MLCVTVTPRSRTLAKVDILNGSMQGDLVEVALDHLVKDPDFSDLLEGRTKPVLLSCRTKSEGGAFSGTDAERTQLLKRAIVAKPDYIEMDLDTARKIKRFGETKRVVSFTRLDRPEPQPGRLIDEAKDADADIVKFMWPTPTIEDAWPLLQLTVSETKLPVVGLGIGDAGLTFSLLGLRHGAPWVYAALEPGMEVCEGQATLFDLVERHRAREITPKTRFIGITGVGEASLRAAEAVNTSFADSGHDARCLPLTIRQPSSLAERLGKLKIKTVLPVGDGELIGSIADAGERAAPDVLIQKDGQWKGYCTIDRAALRVLKNVYEPDWNRANVMVLGGTRLGEIIARDLAAEGAMVSICTLADGDSAALASEIGCRAIPLRQLYNTLADVLVIADDSMKAGVGRGEINPAYIRPNMTVLDVTQLPGLHELGIEARERGAKLVPPSDIYAMHLHAVMKTLTGGGLSENAKAVLVEK